MLSLQPLSLSRTRSFLIASYLSFELEVHQNMEIHGAVAQKKRRISVHFSLISGLPGYFRLLCAAHLHTI